MGSRLLLRCSLGILGSFSLFIDESFALALYPSESPSTDAELTRAVFVWLKYI